MALSDKLRLIVIYRVIIKKFVLKVIRSACNCLKQK